MSETNTQSYSITPIHGDENRFLFLVLFHIFLLFHQYTHTHTVDVLYLFAVLRVPYILLNAATITNIHFTQKIYSYVSMLSSSSSSSVVAIFVIAIEELLILQETASRRM